MTDYPICIHSHIRFSNLKEEITDYRLEALVHGYEVSIDGQHAQLIFDMRYFFKEDGKE